MKQLLALLLGFLVNGTCCGHESEIPNDADSRLIAQRAIAWLVHDDWGQRDKQYQRAAPKDTADWRAWLSRQTSNAMVVKVFHGDATEASDYFIYDRASHKLSDPKSAPNAETIYVRIKPHKDGGWRVRVVAGLWFYVKVVQRDDTFVVSRHEATWIVD